MRFLPSFLRGGGDELGWDDLVKRVVKAIARLARYGARGQVAFPPDVVVRIEVKGGGLEVIRQFVAKSELDLEVGTALANECDCALSALPLREYEVVSGDKTQVVAREGAPRVWNVRIEGGDRDGSALVLPSGRAELRFGRGPFHGADQHLPNDLVVCDKVEFVSRRAGRLRPSGAKLEVESLDQGDGLVVRKANGEAIRPARTATGWVIVRAGDAIDLVDGRGGTVRLALSHEPRDEEDGARGRDHT